MHVLVAVLLLASCLCAQNSDSPSIKQFQAWLTAFNSGDRAVLKKFIDENMPARAGDTDRFVLFRERTGGFDQRRIEDVTATKAVVLVQEHDGEQFARITLEVEPQEPHHITNLGMRAVATPAEFAPARLKQQDLITQLRANLKQWEANAQFSGAVLIAQRGKTIFEEAVGLADRDAHVANTTTTRFRLGSMNKMFTATAVLQLVQAGKVKLDAPFGTYITDYPNKDVASKVTIHQLLTHTGGTGDIFGPEYDQHRLELRTLNDYVKLYGSRGLGFEPGSKWEYSNYGFVLLGVVIERVSGQSYYDYVQEHVYRPAGMSSSGSEPEQTVVPARSKGYMRTPNGWAPNTDTLPYRGTSAGGGYSTVEDLLRFATAIQGRKLLNDEYTRLLTTGKVDVGQDSKYAYGFQETVENGVLYFGHSGGAPGMNGELRIFPTTGYVVIVLGNIDGATGRAMNWIHARLPLQ